jgi:hypothetical protein
MSVALILVPILFHRQVIIFYDFAKIPNIFELTTLYQNHNLKSAKFFKQFSLFRAIQTSLPNGVKKRITNPTSEK